MALAVLVGWTSTTVRADDAPATAVGSISGTVVGVDGKPAANVTVNVYNVVKRAPKADVNVRHGAKKAKGAKAERPAKAGKAAPVAIATATTGADGAFSIPNVPVGDYSIDAGDRKAGTGYARKAVSVKEGQNSVVSLVLATKTKKGA
jgi:hypothetical protein